MIRHDDWVLRENEARRYVEAERERRRLQMTGCLFVIAAAALALGALFAGVW